MENTLLEQIHGQTELGYKVNCALRRTHCMVFKKDYFTKVYREKFLILVNYVLTIKNYLYNYLIILRIK